MTSTLKALKAKSESRLLEEKRVLDRKRELVALTLQFLTDQGYLGAAEALQHEAGVSQSKYQVADNVDLMLVFQHFLEYYEMRFGKAPKVLRKLTPEELAGKRSKPQQPQTNGPSSSQRKLSRNNSNPGELREINDAEQKGTEEDEFQVNGKSISNQRDADMGPVNPEQRILKPLSKFLNGTNDDTRELALMISRDIFTENPNVRWEDVIGLEDAKRLLKEAVVMPMKYPDLFQGGLVSPWKGVLLFGPPGTGKTMLAKAVATQCNTTFFNISASSIVSRYRGDSEKLVRILFDLARYHAPSTIFLDEIDSIMGQRGASGGNEHEASRRMKTELLIQMDGLARNESSRVFILAASNLPWELDAALLRRLEKRVLVRLPCHEGRKAVFEKHLPPNDGRTKDIDYEHLAANTEGYSCADVCLLCKEAAMYPIRRLMSDLEQYEQSRQTSKKPAQMSPVTNEDALAAMKVTKPSSIMHMESSYQKWEQEFGST